MKNIRQIAFFLVIFGSIFFVYQKNSNYFFENDSVIGTTNTINDQALTEKELGSSTSEDTLVEENSLNEHDVKISKLEQDLPQSSQSIQGTSSKDILIQDGWKLYENPTDDLSFIIPDSFVVQREKTSESVGIRIRDSKIIRKKGERGESMSITIVPNIPLWEEMKITESNLKKNGFTIRKIESVANEEFNDMTLYTLAFMETFNATYFESKQFIFSVESTLPYETTKKILASISSMH